MFSPLRRTFAVVSVSLALASLSSISSAQNVTTWHNDNNRTGWQRNETILTPSSVSQGGFGLLWQWGSPSTTLTGRVFAQPLAVIGVQTIYTGCKPCDLVFIATEQDMLYAFNASSSSQTPVWSTDLAQAVGGTAVDCTKVPTYPMCKMRPSGDAIVGPFVGVTGTPVIDVSGGTNTNTLYVAEAAYVGSSIGYYLLAIDITSGSVRGHTPISGSVAGKLPAKCTTSTPAPGDTIVFDENHIQRSALLLLPSNGWVYVAFADLPEATENGWLFAYSFSHSSGTFTQTARISTTPNGTGGGIWQSAAGPASDGTSIYLATANGTFDLEGTSPVDVDAGDALLKLSPSNLALLDFYTPWDVLSYNSNQGLCDADEDFGSGRVLVVPPPFSYNTKSVLIDADKQSYLYVADQANLGKFNSSGGNNLQALLNPHNVLGNKLDPDQGYWASPAYWKYTSGGTTTHMLYYSATTDTTAAAPYPINGYQLLTSGASGPIPDPPTASTHTVFCQYSPTPSVSSNGTTAGTGIVWAIEHGNTGNPTNCGGSPSQAALHAFNAATLTKLYDSRLLPLGTTGSVTTFSTPTIFKGRVYMGTQTGVDVFGLCTACPH